MEKAYRKFTIYFNILLSIGVIVSSYELLTGDYSNPIESTILTFFLIVWVVLTTVFLSRTSDISIENDDEQPKIEFPFCRTLAVFNVILGVLLLLGSIFTFAFYPPHSIFDSSEIMRSIVILIAGGYGFLKINYTVKFLKKLKLSPNKANA